MNEYELKKHAVQIAGHSTSISIETIFWNQLKKIAKSNNISINQLIGQIDAGRTNNLSSAIRVYVLKSLLDQQNRE